MPDALPVSIRRMGPDDAGAVRTVVSAAFADEPEVAGLQDDLAARPDNVGYVAVGTGLLADRIVGHVGLTRCWIDAPERLVEALVLSPLSVAPDVQRRGVGRALLDRAVVHGRESGAPVIVLEGDPEYYARHGWQPAADLGITPPSARIPVPAFQCVRLPSFVDGLRGAVVYPDTFWAHDCVGLRGDVVDEVASAVSR